MWGFQFGGDVADPILVWVLRVAVHAAGLEDELCTAVGQLSLLEARHGADAWVENRIEAAKDTVLGRLPSREFTINQAWLQIVAGRRGPDCLTAAARIDRRPRRG